MSSVHKLTQGFLLRLALAAGMVGAFASTSAQPSVSATGASNEQFPSRPIIINVGFKPGNTTDLTARMLADGVSKVLGQTVIVRNKPAGSGTGMLVQLAQQAPTGYELGVLGSTQIRNQYLKSETPYDVLKDFTPIVQYMSYHFGLVVRADSPWKTL